MTSTQKRNYTPLAIVVLAGACFMNTLVGFNHTNKLRELLSSQPDQVITPVRDDYAEIELAAAEREITELQFQLNAARRELNQIRSNAADGQGNIDYFDPLYVAPETE